MEVLKLDVPSTAPSSPTRHIDFFFYSAPSSPKPNFSAADEFSAEDFDFNFSGHLLDRPALTAADELFHAGKILPLKPPPRLHIPINSPSDSPKSPISKLRGAISPKRRPNPDFDPFEAAIQRTRGRAQEPGPKHGPRKGISRSLSPLRVSEFALQQQQQQHNSANGSSNSSSRGFKKWKLKDLLLFRSASEGRPNTKKYSVSSVLFSGVLNNESKRFNGDDEKSCSSFRSVGEGSSRRRSAVSEDLKKKTSLPYKYGFLGCLRFNPSSSSSSGFQEFTRGFGYPFSR